MCAPRCTFRSMAASPSDLLRPTSAIDGGAMLSTEPWPQIPRRVHRNCWRGGGRGSLESLEHGGVAVSLLDDARKIAAREPDGGYYIESCCLYCDRNISGDNNHAPGCPWLNMPKVVAVL